MQLFHQNDLVITTRWRLWRHTDILYKLDANQGIFLHQKAHYNNVPIILFSKSWSGCVFQSSFSRYWAWFWRRWSLHCSLILYSLLPINLDSHTGIFISAWLTGKTHYHSWSGKQFVHWCSVRSTFSSCKKSNLKGDCQTHLKVNIIKWVQECSQWACPICIMCSCIICLVARVWVGINWLFIVSSQYRVHTAALIGADE